LQLARRFARLYEARPKVKRARLLASAIFLVLAGCNAVPMTYQEWQQEQEDRQKAARAGIEFKSRRQILAEAADMKKVLAETSFR
jgi:hypothetical protein